MKTRRFFAYAGLSLLGSWGSAFAQTRTKPSLDAAQRFPDVIAVKIKAVRADVFDFDVTISSPYDTPQRYADGFRIMSVDGRPSDKPFGERTLWHDHQDEQPFTRDLYSVSIPAGIRSVRVQARDQKFGYGGKSVDVSLPGR